MPLYVALWDATTGHLTNEQDGAYGRLVRWYWKNQRPPADDDQELASICRTDVKTWRKIRVKLAPFFIIENGFWKHDKVERVMLEWKQKREKSSHLASVAAKARWKKTTKKHARGNASSMRGALREAMPGQCPSPSSTEVLVPTGHNTLSKRGSPPLALDGQAAPAQGEEETIHLPRQEAAEDRRALAEEIRASLKTRAKR